jgi:predicted metal-dependent hydrolase
MPKKLIKLKENQIEYTLKNSQRARRMRLAVYCDGNLTVTVPYGFDLTAVENFIRQKTDWIIKKLDYFKKRKINPLFIKSGKKEYKKLKSAANQIATEKVNYFNQTYKFEYNKISIRNQKTRWGSCSRRGNLSFNYKIALLPSDLADYIIVHELCHLKEFNHSLKFWNLVEMTIPLHKEIRKKLR